MKSYKLKALCAVVKSIHRVSDQMSGWPSVLFLAVTISQHTGQSLGTSKLIVVLSRYRPSLCDSAAQELAGPGTRTLCLYSFSFVNLPNCFLHLCKIFTYPVW